MSKLNPIDLARETLKQMSERKLLPTPDNFDQVYCNIGQLDAHQFNAFAQEIVKLFEQTPSSDRGQKEQLLKFNRALSEGRWAPASQILSELYAYKESAELPVPWPKLIAQIIQGIETPHHGLSRSSKVSTTHRLLESLGASPKDLNQKLNNLLDYWGNPQFKGSAQDVEIIEPVMDVEKVRILLLRLLDATIKPRLRLYPDLQDDFETIQLKLSQCETQNDLSLATDQLKSFLMAVDYETQNDERIVTGLKNILSLLLKNISSLSPNNTYLSGQVNALQNLLNPSKALSSQNLNELELGLKDVMDQQTQLQNNHAIATESVQELFNKFIIDLNTVTQETGDFSEKVQQHSQSLANANDLDSMRLAQQALLSDTQSLQTTLTQTHQGLLQANEQVQAAQQKIKDLEDALKEASEKVERDILTGAYNRKGLKDRFNTESVLAAQNKLPLSVGLIDVDNFKKLNDHFGHLTGDEVLKHLVAKAQSQIRGRDIVARFGGEEFIILMPETPIQAAQQLVQRIQRELTRDIFLSDNQKIVITFSAGVALWVAGESEAQTLERADKAMYQAKMAGKNRVFIAE